MTNSEIIYNVLTFLQMSNVVWTNKCKYDTNKPCVSASF